MAVKNDDGPLARALKKAVKKKKSNPYSKPSTQAELDAWDKKKKDQNQRKGDAMSDQEVARHNKKVALKWRKEQEKHEKWSRQHDNQMQGLKENPKNNTKPRPKSTKKS
jgi:hypothetical protein